MQEETGIKEKEVYRFRLFVTGMSVKSVRAIENLNAVCETHLPDRFHIELIDIAVDKALAAKHGIVAIPTLVKMTPGAVRTIIGDLSDRKKLLTILEID